MTDDIGFKKIEIDGRLVWQGDDGTIVPYIAGGAGDDDGGDGGAAPAATVAGGNAPAGGPDNLDTDLGGDPAPPADPAPADPAPPVEEAMVELDGEKYTATQIQEALQISKNQSEFTTKNQEEAARLNTMAKMIEEVRQGPISQTVEAQPSSQNTILTQEDAVKFQEALLSENPSEAITQLVTFIQSTVSTQANEEKAENAFMTAHPDYLQVISSPEFKTFKAQSPLGNYLNDVNGYYEFKASTSGAALEAATAAGVKEGEKTANAHAAAKAGLTILNGGGGVQQPARTQITPDMSHGDVLNKATAFLAASRQNE